MIKRVIVRALSPGGFLTRLFQLLRTPCRGMQDTVVAEDKGTARAIGMEQKSTRKKAEVIELPTKRTSKLSSRQDTGKSRSQQGPPSTPKETWRSHVAIGCILLCTGVALSYALGAWNASTVFLDRGTVAQAPTQVSVSATPTSAASETVFTVATDEAASTQAFDDGTEVEFLAHTTLEVDYSPRHRMLRLRAGGGIFDVARDPDRPFTVEAGGLRATALGTKFKVTLEPTVRVEVYEGVVAVSEGPAEAGGMVMKLQAGDVYERPTAGK